MKKLFNKIETLIEKIENYPITFFIWLISFSGIILIRILFESWIDGIINRSASYIFYNIANTFIFFLFAYIIFLGFLNKFLKISIKKVANIMLWGYLIIMFPPVIDHIIFGDSRYLNFYGIYGLSEMFQRFFLFFGDNPDFGVTYGTRIEIAITVILLFIYAYIKTHRWIKSLLVAFFSYVILFFLATFPSWVTILLKGFSKGFLEVGELDIVQLFMTPTRIFSKEVGDVINALSVKLSLIYSLIVVAILLIGFFLNYREKLLIFLKNTRPVQIIYHLGLLGIGAGLGIKFTTVTWNIDLFNIISFLNVAIAIIFSWVASVVINDIIDKKIDSISNKQRPLILEKFSKNEYKIIGIVLFLASILFATLVSSKIAMFLVAYQVLAWIYSVPPFRFKRVPIVATLISAIASLLILFSGFVLISPDQNISQLPSQIIWLLIISLVISLPIKDLKDKEGDKCERVYTIPVIFGEYWGKIVIGSGIFISYILSVLFLREFNLLFWAIVFGGISFWIITLSGKNKKITYHNVVWWIMGIVFIYGIMLIGYI